MAWGPDGTPGHPDNILNQIQDKAATETGVSFPPLPLATFNILRDDHVQLQREVTAAEARVQASVGMKCPLFQQ